MLKNKKRIFEPTKKSEASNYFCEAKRYSLYTTKKREIKQKKKLEKSGFYIQLIVKMFSTKHNKKAPSSKLFSLFNLSQSSFFQVVN